MRPATRDTVVLTRRHLTHELLSVAGADAIALWDGRTGRDLSGNGFNGTPSSVRRTPGPDGRMAGLYHANGHIDVYSAALNTDFPGDAGSLLAIVRLPIHVWSDGAVRRVCSFADGTNANIIYLNRTTVNDQLAGARKAAGGTAKQVNSVNLGGRTDWLLLGSTWSVASDRFRYYENGIQQSSDQTLLDTWGGTLDSTKCVIGASNTTPASPWVGGIAYVMLIDRELNAAEMRRLAGVLP